MTFRDEGQCWRKRLEAFFIVVFACRTNGFVFPSFLNCPNLCLILLPFSLIYFLVLRGPEVLNLTMKKAVEVWYTDIYYWPCSISYLTVWMQKFQYLVKNKHSENMTPYSGAAAVTATGSSSCSCRPSPWFWQGIMPTVAAMLQRTWPPQREGKGHEIWNVHSSVHPGKKSNTEQVIGTNKSWKFFVPRKKDIL